MGMVKGRRYWNNQITTPNWLEVGMIVVKVYSHLDGGPDIFRITELGLKSKHLNNLYFNCVSSKGHKDYHFYADFNLTPYKSKWNRTNYLRWPTDEEVKEFEKGSV